MDILIFGGNRFTGKLLVKILFSKGHNVTIINRRGISPVRCNVLKCDRNDEKKVKSLIKGMKFDCVIDMCLYNKKQAQLSVEIFKNKIKKYIFISSVAVYNKSKTFPIDETYPLGIWPMFGDYGIDKQSIETYFKNQKDFPYISLRPSYIIGKNNHLNREGYYFDKLLKNEEIDLEGNGQAILSFIFVEDVAEIIYKATIEKINIRQSYNLCNDEFITIKGFIELIAEILNKKPVYNKVNEIVSFKNENCYFSNKKIKKDFKFNFKALKPGLIELSEFYINKNNIK